MMVNESSTFEVGLADLVSQWDLICAVHGLLKSHRARERAKL